VVARQILDRFRAGLAGEVSYQRVKRSGLTREVWSDSHGNRRVLLRRTGGSSVAFVRQGDYQGWFGTTRTGQLLLGERIAGKRWSVERTPAATNNGSVPRKATVGIVGPGEVGTSAALQVALQLKQTGVRDVKVVLLGRTRASAQGKALDVAQAVTGAGLQGVSVVGTADYRSLRKADAVVVTAGSPRRPGMSRSDLVGQNASVISDIAHRLKRNLPSGAPVLMVTNPLDAMTQLASSILEPGKGSTRRVMGMAGALDSARLERVVADSVARKYRVPASRVGRVSATVIGNHGDEMVPLLSRLRVDGVPASRLLDRQELGRALDSTRTMGATITRLAGRSASMAPGSCIARMVTAMVTDRGDVLPASVPLRGEMGLKQIAIGLPVRLGRGGATIVPTRLDAGERAAFARSVEKVRQDLRALPGR